MAKLTEKEIASKIDEYFEDNYQFLKQSGGHTIDRGMLKKALNQVRCYYKKNRELMDRITDSEIKLTLPQQITPQEKIPYSIEGVVDIVEEGEKVLLYDLKTHDPERIRENLTPYRAQLFVYAHIWKNLQKHRLDDTAIIATPIPKALDEALEKMENGDASYRRNFEKEMEKWEPIIPLGYDENEVADMIEQFGAVVEKIENRKFNPPTVSRLKEKQPGATSAFGTHVCRNCDVRFSCASYRQYVMESSGAKRNAMMKYMQAAQDTNETFIEDNL
ncbi:MAG: PD-(D/E)XK nuclease family protein [Fibrobacteraceae bacterium]|nr:PD-(D/E)XK nuclease family protein [Fibrobacteraceae bacterium]